VVGPGTAQKEQASRRRLRQPRHRRSAAVRVIMAAQQHLRSPQPAAPKGLLIVQPLFNLLFLNNYASSSASSGAGMAQVGVSSRVMFLVATMPD
jgi:hypothetical protein